MRRERFLVFDDAFVVVERASFRLPKFTFALSMLVFVQALKEATLSGTRTNGIPFLLADVSDLRCNSECEGPSALCLRELPKDVLKEHLPPAL